MNNVVQLKKVKESSPEYCWECGCGCQYFILLVNGDVICVDCNYIQSRIRSFDTRDNNVKPTA